MKDEIMWEYSTNRLLIRSLEPADLPFYHHVFGDPAVMALYTTGEPKDKEWVEQRFTTWRTRWKEGNPFSAMVVLLRDTGIRIGHIVIGKDGFGGSEMAYVVDQEYQGRGYGKEMIRAVLDQHVNRLQDYDAIDFIRASTDERNIASQTVLLRNGFIKEDLDDQRYQNRNTLFYKYVIPK